MLYGKLYLKVTCKNLSFVLTWIEPTKRRKGGELEALHAGVFGQNLPEVLTDWGDHQFVDIKGFCLTSQLQISQEPGRNKEEESSNKTLNWSFSQVVSFHNWITDVFNWKIH